MFRQSEHSPILPYLYKRLTWPSDSHIAVRPALFQQAGQTRNSRNGFSVPSPGDKRLQLVAMKAVVLILLFRVRERARARVCVCVCKKMKTVYREIEKWVYRCIERERENRDRSTDCQNIDR